VELGPSLDEGYDVRPLDRAPPEQGGLNQLNAMANQPLLSRPLMTLVLCGMVTKVGSIGLIPM
jgi:hypothetical protein